MISSDRKRRVRRKIAEIFHSQNEEWITAISMTIDAMYQQFIREREDSANNDGSLEKIVVGDANMVRGHRRGVGRVA